MTSGKDWKAERNMALIKNEEFDIFDRLVVIEGWFEEFGTIRQKNLIKFLEGKVHQ